MQVPLVCSFSARVNSRFASRFRNPPRLHTPELTDAELFADRTAITMARRDASDCKLDYAHKPASLGVIESGPLT